MSQKGMSQAIGVIIAATVLMMTALVAIFIVQGGLSDTDEGISNSGCLQVLEAKCSTEDGQVTVPATCSDSEIVSANPGSSISCGSWGGGS